jgi:hypothetical protein
MDSEDQWLVEFFAPCNEIYIFIYDSFNLFLIYLIIYQSGCGHCKVSLLHYVTSRKVTISQIRSIVSNLLLSGKLLLLSSKALLSWAQLMQQFIQHLRKSMVSMDIQPSRYSGIIDLITH